MTKKNDNVRLILQYGGMGFLFVTAYYWWQNGFGYAVTGGLLFSLLMLLSAWFLRRR